MSKGFTKENTKKLFKWEGKKELPWILFFTLLMFVIWAYFTETSTCREMIADECFQRCKFYETTAIISEKFPSLNCDFELNTCVISGISPFNMEGLREEFPTINLTIG